MIDAFVAAWDAHQGTVRDRFALTHPENYLAVVRAVVQMLADASTEYDKPDPERIHEIDDGDYQGMLVYVIGASGYQPYTYWYVTVAYGSCSGCDTLQEIRNYDSDPPTPQQVSDYMTLALHIVQGLHVMTKAE